jgi:hypothetical protein
MPSSTPLLRWGPALLKLELLRAPAPGHETAFAATGHHALSRARHGMQVALQGSITHEMRETLKIWRAEVVAQAEEWQPDPSALIDELLQQLEKPPSIVIAAASESAALRAVRKQWPRTSVLAITSDDDLPDLPPSSEFPSLRVSRAEANAARARVARTLGLLAGHGSAVAAVQAFERGGLALITAPGEREFSLDPPPTSGARKAQHQ